LALGDPCKRPGKPHRVDFLHFVHRTVLSLSPYLSNPRISLVPAFLRDRNLVAAIRREANQAGASMEAIVADRLGVKLARPPARRNGKSHSPDR
jgi:hypothetical protein